ncbi:DMT family transporter [Aminipila luticellarii]|uniref:EamA family transporter n=1 Tax=Aminipila luticellarii TaxID=2507160 RepID=A0A410PUH8_9FIRM|nr:DMT family transporter [Aminipila luticellarii]QAT42602.1 EamA family transporter [Aminipila luticellarii]
MKRVGIYIFLTAFLFGTMEVALKLAGNGMDSFQLTFWRFFIGGILLMPFAFNEIRINQTRLELKDFGYLLIVGILCIPISMLFFQLGVMRSNASTASVIMCINPLFTMIFAHFMSDEKFSKKKMIVMIWGIAGLFFMVRPWNIQEGNTPIGMLFMLIAAATFGLYTVAGKNSIKKMGIMAQTSISFILGSGVLLVIMLFLHKPVFRGVADNLVLVLYIGIFVTGLGYYFYFAAIKLSDATTGSIAFFIKPAIAPVIAVIILGDKLLWNTYLGIALILIASYLNIYNKKTEDRNIEQEQIEFK